MDAQEAIATAKKTVSEFFASDGPTHIGLEEIRYNPETDQWHVTIGFTRAWEGPQGVARWTPTGDPWPRTFKTVEIDQQTGRVTGVLHWPVAA